MASDLSDSANARTEMDLATLINAIRRNSATLGLALVAALYCWSPNAQAQTYQLTDLSTLGGNYNIGEALNASGQVTGGVGTETGMGTLNLQAYVSAPGGGALTGLGSLGGSVGIGYAINDSGQVTGDANGGAFISNGTTLTALGTLGGDQSEGVAINASGQVTGDASTAGNAAAHAFVYSNGKMTDLGTLGGTYSYGLAINDSGQVAGYADNQAGSNTFHAFVSNGTTLTDLGTLGGSSSMAVANNASGQVTGWANTANGDQHAFLYSNGKMTDLGTLGTGTQSYGNAINAKGQVTGYAYIQGSTNNFDAFISSGTTLKDLGTLGGAEAEGLAINVNGEVVGFSYTAAGSEHGFLYNGGHLIDLNSLLSTSEASLYTITSGIAINDNGQILADGILDSTGTSQAFLLNPSSPVPLPATVWLMLSSIGCFAAFARHREKRSA